MTQQEILEWIRANRICYLATVEGNQPRVRAFGCARADEDGIVFNTQTYKDVYKQLIANPNVELCFYNRQESRQIRVSGRVEFIKDEQVKKDILERMPFLQRIVDERGLDVLAPFCLKHGTATVWSRETGGQEKQQVEL